MHTNVMQGAKPNDPHQAWNEFAAACTKLDFIHWLDKKRKAE